MTNGDEQSEIRHIVRVELGCGEGIERSHDQLKCSCQFRKSRSFSRLDILMEIIETGVKMTLKLLNFSEMELNS